MFYYLGEALTAWFGPLRLLTSHLFLAGTGALLAAVLSWRLIPRLAASLPRDGGRLHAVDGHLSTGKPTGAGRIFVPVFIICSLLFVPLGIPQGAVLGCVLLSMLEGAADDRTPGGWGEVRLAAADAGIALAAAAAICGFRPVAVWLPFFKADVVLQPVVYVPAAAALLWITINATNCSDGVDGLSAGLTGLSLSYLGAILFLVVGHTDVAAYLLVPHYPDGALWGGLCFIMLGCLAGYLWHNAHPSAVLMGDAGARPLGLLLGVMVLATGNPALILIVAGVLLANGGTGLVKVALLRFFRLRILHDIRFPLHDHLRHRLGWSPTQVFIRLMLVQAVGTPVLLLILLKIR